MADSTTDRAIVVTRLFNAPRDLVFDAFTVREHVEQWWLPGQATIHEYDGTPGGLWRYSMPDPDGGSYSFRVQFIHLDRPERLVYDYGVDGEGAPEPVRTSVTFAEENGRTRVTMQLLFATAAEREEAAQYGAAAGAQQALGSLADYLATYGS